MPQQLTKPGARVQVVEGVYRGRHGVTASEPDRTGSVRVTLDYLSVYDKSRPRLVAWIPVNFLKLKGE